MVITTMGRREKEGVGRAPAVPEQRARLETLFRRCCLFVMPSRYELFGIAPLEAMVNQIPCLVTNRWACSVIRFRAGSSSRYRQTASAIPSSGASTKWTPSCTG